MKQLYRNIKKDTIYRILYEAIDCTNSRDGLDVVVYSSMDNPFNVYVRDKKEFLEKFEEV